MSGEAAAIVNPFPGPQPYRASDRGRFYGREAVGHELASMILAHRCVALFGPSGAGKSSVMQAAVIPELDENYDFRHVAIDGWPADEEPVAWLLYTLHAQLKLAPPETPLGRYESVEWTVRQAFRRSDRPILIYLDQIEQLLFSQRDVASVEAFFDWLDRFAERPIRGLHLVVAMREDYLGRFRDRARGRHRLLENGFRLGPMTVGEIVGAVCRGAADGAPPQPWSPAVMRPLMLQVRVPGQGEVDEAEVQTAFAQIVCRALFHERATAGPGASVDAPVAAEPILQGYLENTLAGLGPLRGAAERLLEDHLVATDGTRTLLTEEAARASGVAVGPDLDAILRDLERAAILRAEQHRGTRYFELGHDWLAKKVHDRKQEGLARAAALDREREQEAQRRAAAEQLRAAQAETRRARKVVAIVTVFGLLALVLGVFAWTQREVARSETARARVAEVEARAERDRANEASAEARAARQRAEASLTAEQAAKLAASAAAEDALAQKQIAEEQRAAAETSEQTAQVALVGQRRATKEALAQRGRAEANMRRAEDEARRARDANLLAVALAVVADDPTAALALLLEVEQPQRTRGWTPATVAALQRPASQAVLGGHEGYVVAAAFSPDGTRVATGSHDHGARVSRVDGAGPGLELRGHADEVTGLVFHPDGRRIATGSSDGTVRVWPADGRGAPRVLEVGAPVVALGFSPAGDRLAVAGRDGEARVFVVDGEGAPQRLVGHTAALRSIRFSPDGARVVTASDDGSARVWAVGGDGPAVLLGGHQGTVYTASFSPDGAQVVTAGDDRTARVFRVAGEGATRAATQVLRGHGDAVYHAEFAAKGGRVVTASRDRSARIWTLGGDEVRVLRGHSDKLYVARFDPGGGRVATVSRDGTARLWPADGSGDPRVLRGHTAPVVDVAFSADGRRLVTAAEDGTARVWDTEAAHGEVVLRGHTGAVRYASFAADGRRVVTAASDRSARVWAVEGAEGRVVLTLAEHPGALMFAGFAGAGAVVTGGEDGALRFWNDRKLDRTVQVVPGGRAAFVSLGAGGRVALASATDVATRVTLADGARAALRGHTGLVLHAAASPDGARVVTVGDDRSARVWAADGTAQAVLRGHEGSIYFAGFSPDGRRIVTASWDRTARVWSAAGGPAEAVLVDHEKVVRSAEFSGDGLRVVTASDDGTAKIWRSDGAGEVVTLHGHEGPVLHASFRPDGRQVVTAGSDRTARVWAADFDNPELLRAKIRATTTVCLTPARRVALLGEGAAEAEARHRDCEAKAGR